MALSRVRSLEGLTLTSFNPSKIILDQKVIEFYEECRNPRKSSAEESDSASVSLSDKPVGLEKWFSKVKLQG